MTITARKNIVRTQHAGIYRDFVMFKDERTGNFIAVEDRSRPDGALVSGTGTTERMALEAAWKKIDESFNPLSP